MFFVIRETAGWFLIVAALYLIQLALLDYVEAGKVVEAGIGCKTGTSRRRSSRCGVGLRPRRLRFGSAGTCCQRAC